jgi:hypothetical protein
MALHYVPQQEETNIKKQQQNNTKWLHVALRTNSDCELDVGQPVGEVKDRKEAVMIPISNAAEDAHAVDGG